MNMRRAAARAAGLALIVAACSGESAAPPRTDPTIPPASTTTATTDPYAVPAVIDEAYVNTVLAGLDQAVGDVTRLVVRTRSIPPEALQRLRAIYADLDFLQLNVDSYQSDLARNLQGYRTEPGNGRTTVAHLLAKEPTCVFARVNRDFSAVSTLVDPRLTTQWVAIVPKTLPDPFEYNPTPWAFIYDGFERGFVEPADPCDA